MSWYNKSKVIKISSKSTSEFGAAEVDFIPDNQMATMGTIFDVQRYVVDYYMTRIALSKTNTKLSVSLVINNGMLGNTAWSQFWFYNQNEMKKAKSTYEKIIKATQETVNEFVDLEIPSSLFWTYLKKRTLSVDQDSIARLNIPTLNYYKKYQGQEVLDWRKSIYGNRYPAYNEESDKQYQERNK